jgi:hypothetical protein
MGAGASPLDPKHEILKSLMWDMGYAICAGTRLFAAGFYLTSFTLWNPACGGFARGEIPQGKSHISHPHLEKGIAIST